MGFKKPLKFIYIRLEVEISKKALCVQSLPSFTIA